MRVSLSQNARMEQRLVQSPQMIQAMQILQLSALDLQQRIEQELLENPFLEEDAGETGEDGPAAEDGAVAEDGSATEDGREEALETREDAPEPPEPDERAVEEAAIDGILEVLERYENDMEDGRRRSSPDETDRKFEALSNTPSSYHSLGDALLEQTALLDLDERRRDLVEYLVYSLDQRGYLTDPLEELVADCPVPDVTADELRAVLVELRASTHPALGARDLRECLLLQLDELRVDSPLVRKLVEEHLEDITTNRLPRIARATGASIEEVYDAIEAIRGLDPVPGREYGEDSAESIHPDVVVEEVDGRFEVRLTREGVPSLRVSPSHKRMLRQAAKGDSVRKWIKKRIESARWFIDALEQRQNTLLRISRAIFDQQTPFLQDGVKALRPLRMLEVADATGVHISTVSRAVSGKYVQTPHGIYALRFFFSGGTSKDSGEMASQASIKQRIKELVDKEDPHAPLSDDRLAELLKERDGISIARRTVTKYRKALAIPSSGQRRHF